MLLLLLCSFWLRFLSETPKGQSLKSIGILKLCRKTLKGLIVIMPASTFIWIYMYSLTVLLTIISRYIMFSW